MWAGREVLVTGGGGFIGSHLVESLLRQGARVRVLELYTPEGSWGWLDTLEPTPPALDVRLGTITDADLVRRTMDGVDTVFHLAALVGIPYSYVAPAHCVDVNVVGTLRVLEAARDVGVRRVVHTSTSECFGTAQYVPMDEQHPLVAQSPYAATKVAADQLAGSFFRSFATPVVTLRPFNTFGPRQSRRAVLPTIVAQLLVGREVRLGNTTPVRDLTYVADTVEAFLAAGATDGVEGETFVVGTGEGWSVAQLVTLVGELLGVAPVVRTDPARLRPATSEVDRLVCDPSKALRALGWKARTPFREGLAATVEWLRSRPRPWSGSDDYVI